MHCISLAGGHYEKGWWMSIGTQPIVSMSIVCIVWGFVELRANSPKQFSGFDLQGLGELHDCHEGQISLTSLNCPHERNVQPRQFCQSLLREFLPEAKLPHTFAEGGHNDNHKWGHRMRV